MGNYFCIDIGGTSIKYGVLDEPAEFLMSGEIPTEAFQGGPGIVRRIVGLAKKWADQYSIAGICVSTAGMVDCEKGEITYSAPLIPNYAGTQIKRIMEDSLKLPCEVENDVNCAALAEYFAGAAKGSNIMLCLTIGTGIGGAAIINNQVFHGCSNSGCEIGYMNMPGGMFQDLAATSILVRRVAEEKGISEEAITGKYVFEQAKAGDGCCIRAIDAMADMLGMGIANICYVLNPETVVLGGGIMAQEEYLYPRIRKSLDKYLISSISGKTKLSFAQNKNQAGMLGAYYHFKGRRQMVL